MPQRETTEEKVAKITARQAVVGVIITAVASIATTFIATLLSTHADSKPSYQPVGDRADALKTTWTGIYNQAMGPDGLPMSGPLEFTLEPHNRLIEGDGNMEVPRKDGTHLKLYFRIRGGFLHDRFLRLEYENRDNVAIQFGSVIAELSPDGKDIIGSFLGFGAQSQRIVTGTISLHR